MSAGVPAEAVFFRVDLNQPLEALVVLVVVSVAVTVAVGLVAVAAPAPAEEAVAAAAAEAAAVVDVVVTAVEVFPRGALQRLHCSRGRFPLQ